MDVAVDTSVLASDQWLDGRNLDALFSYLRDTKSRLLLFEVVEVELEARCCAPGFEPVAKLSLAKAAREDSLLV